MASEADEEADSSIKIASYYSLASSRGCTTGSETASTSAAETEAVENYGPRTSSIASSVSQRLVKQRPTTSLNAAAGLETKSKISKELLEKLVQNRNYCKLCPLKAQPDIFKTKGALKFHLRIKHFK